MQICYCKHHAVWPDVDIYARKNYFEKYCVFLVLVFSFLVYMYYTHLAYWTSIFGTNRVYYIQIFTFIFKAP